MITMKGMLYAVGAGIIAGLVFGTWIGSNKQTSALRTTKTSLKRSKSVQERLGDGSIDFDSVGHS